MNEMMMSRVYTFEPIKEFTPKEQEQVDDIIRYLDSHDVNHIERVISKEGVYSFHDESYDEFYRRYFSDKPKDKNLPQALVKLLANNPEEPMAKPGTYSLSDRQLLDLYRECSKKHNHNKTRTMLELVNFVRELYGIKPTNKDPINTVK